MPVTGLFLIPDPRCPSSALRNHADAMLLSSSNRPSTPANIGSTPMPRTTLASRIFSPIEAFTLGLSFFASEGGVHFLEHPCRSNEVRQRYCGGAARDFASRNTRLLRARYSQRDLAARIVRLRP